MFQLDVAQEQRNILECIMGFVTSDEPDVRKVELVESVLEYWASIEDAPEGGH